MTCHAIYLARAQIEYCIFAPMEQADRRYSWKGRMLQMLYTSIAISLSATRTVPLSFTFVIGYGPRKATFLYLADQSFFMRTLSPTL